MRSPDEVEALVKQAQSRSHTDIQRLFALAMRTAEDIGRSPMPKVSLEMGLLRLFDVAPVADLQALIGRLDAIAQGKPPVGGPGGGGAVAPSAPQAPSKAPELRPVRPGKRADEAPHGRGPQGAPAPSQAVASAVPHVPAPMVEAAGAAIEGVHAGWQRFIDTVRSKRPALASMLEHGRLIVFTPEQVCVAYTQGTFYWDSACDKENRELFTNVLEAQFGQAVPFNVVAQTEDHGAVASLAEMSAERQRSQVNDITNAALEHKAVRDAVSILGGEVKEIRPLQSGG